MINPSLRPRVSKALAFECGGRKCWTGTHPQNSTHGFPSFSIRLAPARVIAFVPGYRGCPSKVSMPAKNKIYCLCLMKNID